MVREEERKIILDNGVSVKLIDEHFCPKCKQVSENNELCYDCKNKDYSFNSVLTIGYYISRWYNKRDKYDNANSSSSDELKQINPEYRFSKLINDAKERNDKKTIEEKKKIIKILCQGLTWKLKNYHHQIIKEINFLVHIPKFRENEPGRFNHGYYYAHYLSRQLSIPFYRNLLTENKDCDKKDPNRFSISSSPERIKGKNIMIVDDVFTNGDTKDPIAEMLKERGASEVYIGVIARTKQ